MPMHWSAFLHAIDSPAHQEATTHGKSRSLSCNAEMEAFGEIWTSENTAGHQIEDVVPVSDEVAPCGEGLTEEELILLAAKNISATDPAACGQLLQIPRVGLPLKAA